ncbi:Piso0_002593 [Millerozyma farinosa CBS 7064]|uniref:Piso0_002593 protein n=1 Tax=Pichia sorbitophila (strain ATCC MYA-4447 / BCRC 22081 / CBS 7064 / NBRC 10061 / NRRL Y-12695) TaxID=559304 RepID=G8YD11_PICSO|nr:Piso0_002593 [Millerozyma farinosa CBS 7064]
MDTNLLLQWFSATLEINQEIRQNAEARLKEISNSPGFLGCCLDILSSDNVNPTIKKAVAVYFKNRLGKIWAHEGVDEGEKPFIKDNLLSVIVKSDYNIKRQLIPVLRVLVSYEFPNKWASLLPSTASLLQQTSVNVTKVDELSSLYTGLLCFSEICRKFRWVSNSDRSNEIDPIIDQVFPHLLDIGNAIIANSEEISEISAEILKLILKAYKFVTYFDLPVVLQTQKALVSWGEFHGAIINMKPPAYVLHSNLSEQEKSFLQISKCYKWAVANIYRVFTRYASQSLSKKFAYTEFQQMFCNEYLPHLIPSILSIIEQWCTGERWISQTALFHIIQLLSHCVTQKVTWEFIKPYFENLVSHLIYPLLCPSDETLEVFENDPQEYIHSNIDIYDDLDSPDAAAIGLLVTFVEKRRKTTLDPIIQLVYNQLTLLQSIQETLEIAKKKDGVMRIVGGISHYLVLPSSPYSTQMEGFLKTLIFPNFSSSYDFLKARALEISSKFSDLKFSETQSLNVLFKGIIENFKSTNEAGSCLPLNLECALAIQAFLHLPEFQEILSGIIVPTMSKLLDLSNEIDSDAVSMVMQECVENFSEQLQPFGIDLMKKLVDQFLRLAVEINEASQVDIDDFNHDYEDQTDKVMAAIGLLNTMITVLLSFENSIEICVRLEEVMAPAIEYVLANKIDDFLTEVGELIENSTFLLRSISPTMWKIFDLLYLSFTDGIALMYTEELSQCIQNFLLYGSRDLLNSPELVNKFFEIFKIINDGDDSQTGYNDKLFACELAQSFILTLQNHSEVYIPQIIDSIMDILISINSQTQNAHISAFDINILDVVIASMIYGLDTTLMKLQERNQVETFLSRWFHAIPNLKRVYDLKLSALSIISLMNSNHALLLLNQDLRQELVSKLAQIFEALPRAIENLEKKRKSFSESDFVGSGANFNDYDDANEEDIEEYLAKEDPNDSEHIHDSESTTEYLNFLQEENHKLKNSGFFDEDDNSAVEDPLATTPLDGINVFQVFKDVSDSFRESDMEKYVFFFGNIPEQQSSIFQNVYSVSQ